MDKAGLDTVYGSCLCGVIKYQISGKPVRRVICHCTSCKKSSGAMFATNAFYTESQIKLISSDEIIKTYLDKSPDSGGTLTRSFCGTCGSTLFTRPSNFQGIVVVACGTIDLTTDDEAAEKWTPEQEYFCKRRGSWLSGVGAPPEHQYQAMS